MGVMADLLNSIPDFQRGRLPEARAGLPAGADADPSGQPLRRGALRQRSRKGLGRLAVHREHISQG